MHARSDRYLGTVAGPASRSHFANAMKAASEHGALITTHDVPDCDGLGTAFAVQRILLKRNVPADIITGPHIHLTDPLVEHLGIRTKRWCDIPETDLRPIIVVDTNTPALLNGMSSRRNSLLMVIDHHKVGETVLKPLHMICNQSAISASEIAASLIERKLIERDRQVALALAVGIASDSERLSDADVSTLRIFESLMQISGAKKKEIDALAYPELPPAMVAAIMDEMRSVESMLYGNKVIAVAPSSLENPAILANEIRDMGSSIAAVLNEHEGGWHKVSFRVRFMEAHAGGIHANDIARRTSEICGMPEGMRGGGHIDKAAAMIKASYREIADAVFTAAKEVIDLVAGKQ